MASLIEQLTEAKIRAISSPGLYADGRGLYLQVRPRSRSWIYRFTLSGRTRDMGLGPLSDVSLIAARAKTAECRALHAQGIDPLEHAKTLPSSIEPPIAVPVAALRTFREAAEDYLASALRKFRNEKHKAQWRYTLEAYAYPVIGDLPVTDVQTPHVLAVLRPIWLEIYETASRLRGRIERILARETVEGRRSGPNPATWKGHLQEALEARSVAGPVKHHAAMPVPEMPTFFAKLQMIDTVSSAALQFLIFTVARTSEVTGAQSFEIDFARKIWIVPAERMKALREHIVPLSVNALEVLHQIWPLSAASGGLIFPGTGGNQLSQMTMLALLQRQIGATETVHGFRSTFRDWAGDYADVPRDLAETALAHAVGDATEAAYRRLTAVERRRPVMQQWADFCCTRSGEAKLSGANLASASPMHTNACIGSERAI